MRGVVTLVLTLAGSGPAAVQAQQSAAPSVVFDGVTVVDVEQGKLVPDQRVVITGSRIQAVGSARAVELPKQAQVVDARGKYLIPGLWDMHNHLANLPEFAIAYVGQVAFGITGIREAASTTTPRDTLLKWRREVAAGARVGPRVIFGYSIDLEGPNDIERVGEVVRSIKASGADFIKTFHIPRRVYFALAAEARRQGIPFGGHIEQGDLPAASAFIFAVYGDREKYFADAAESRRDGTPFLEHLETAAPFPLNPEAEMTPQEASDSGASIIDHMLSYELTSRCMGPEASVKKCQPIAERFQRNGTWAVPTFYVDSVRRVPGDGIPDSLDLLTAAHGAGLPIMAGTDGLELGALHTELSTLVAEGLTTSEALQSATLNPAKYLKGTDSLGTVAPGKLADLVLLDADPLADITNTTKIRAVVANGRYFDRAALDSMLAEARAKIKQHP